MKAKRRNLKAAVVGLVGLLVCLVLVLTFHSCFAPFGAAQGARKPGMARYIQSGQLLADVRTAAGMLHYLFEPEGQPSAA